MKSLKIFFAFIFCIVGFTARSQSFYRLEYMLQKEGDLTPYSAFFVKYETDDGFIRIKYPSKETKDTVILQMDAVLLYSGLNDKNADSNKLLYQLTNPVFITKSNDKSRYDTLLLCLKINASTKFPEAFGMTSKRFAKEGDLNKFSRKDTIAFDFLKSNQGFVMQYFTTKDKFFRFLFPRGSRGDAPAFSDAEKSTKFYLLIVADTKDSSIGKSASVDIKNMEDGFKFIVDKFMGGKPVTTILSGDKVSKKNVEAAMNDVLGKVTSQDVFVFYYSGHGFRFTDDASRFPRMKLWPWNADNKLVWKGDSLVRDFVKNNSLSMDDVYNRVRSKGARLNLVISDCCNEIKLQTTKPAYEPGKNRGEEEAYITNPKNEYFRQLFLGPKQTIRITATDKDERAPGNDVKGGYFTKNFLSTLSVFLNGLYTNPVSWDDLCRKTISKSRSNAKTVRTPTGVPFVINPFYVMPD